MRRAVAPGAFVRRSLAVTTLPARGFLLCEARVWLGVDGRFCKYREQQRGGGGA